MYFDGLRDSADLEGQRHARRLSNADFKMRGRLIRETLRMNLECISANGKQECRKISVIIGHQRAKLIPRDPIDNSDIGAGNGSTAAVFDRTVNGASRAALRKHQRARAEKEQHTYKEVFHGGDLLIPKR